MGVRVSGLGEVRRGIDGAAAVATCACRVLSAHLRARDVHAGAATSLHALVSRSSDSRNTGGCSAG
jgi:hypothetical protein